MKETDIKIFLIEDSEDDAILLQRRLKKEGFHFKIKRISKIQDLAYTLESFNPDIVITDHNLNFFDSNEVIKIVRQYDKDLPIIIVSGEIGEEIAINAMRAGASDYIMKDNLMRLGPVIERELREAESRKGQRIAEETIRFMAYHDPLTGLTNRFELERSLKDILDSSKRTGDTHCLLYLDLDQFKVINDTCGHIAGDELLKQVSLIMEQAIGRNAILARLGGDEFAILLKNCKINQAKKIGYNILKILSDFRFNWLDKMFSISGSIGALEITSSYENINEMLSMADIACYAAKDAGRNRLQVYSHGDSEMTFRREELRWLSRLNEGIVKQRLVLFKQEIIPLQNDERTFYEFLLRMRGNNGELILPGAFIPAAERYNLMPIVDRWVIENVLIYIKTEYAKKAIVPGKVKFFINLSGASLSDDTFFDFVIDKIESSEISPDFLCFEITETSALSDMKKTIDFINLVRSKGSSFALDDFGSGMCSYGYLKSLPVDFLKIDGSFVSDMMEDPMDYAIVESINKISHIIGLKTIAEYVENDEVLKELIKLGIDFAQGFGISRPSALHPET